MSRTLPPSRFAALCLLVCATLPSGCGEKDVPHVIDHDVLLQYLAQSEDAVDLFRVSGLLPTKEYEVPGDAARYRILVDSTRREIELETEVDTVKKRVWPDGSVEYYRTYHDFGSPFGRKWDSEAAIDDFFYIRLLRISGTDTTVQRRVWAISRYGYFLKLGGDEEDYLGWKLWAYNGGGPSSGFMAVAPDSGAAFSGDLAGYDNIPFLFVRECLTTSSPTLPCSTIVIPHESSEIFRRLDELGTVRPNALLAVDCQNVSARTRYRLLSLETSNEQHMHVMEQTGPGHFVDTIEAPASDARLWDLLFVQDFEYVPIPGSNPPDSQLSWTGWCVPFQVR